MEPTGEPHSDIRVQIPLWARLGFQFGFPTGLALLLVGALLGWIPSPMLDTLRRIESQGYYQGQYQSVLLRQICYQLAVRKEEQWRCEPTYRGYEEPAPPKRN